jgi:tRNA pseudouridine55 synthase
LSRAWRNSPPRLLVVDKPTGPTSFEIVDRVRRWSGYEKVGHAGTLDPFASGVLVLGLGGATRLLRYLSEGEKCYRLGVEFGRGTDSDDLTGTTIAVGEPSFGRDELTAALPDFIGEIEQRPPTLSAIKIDGRRAYELHRRGQQLDPMPLRRVAIHDIELLEFAPPRATLRVRCGGGAYMRSLARDLGQRLACPAHAASLLRESVGPFRLEMAPEREGLKEYCAGESIGIDPAQLVRDWSSIQLDEAELGAVRHGIQPPQSWSERIRGGDPRRPLAILDRAGGLAAVAEATAGGFRLALVLDVGKGD